MSRPPMAGREEKTLDKRTGEGKLHSLHFTRLGTSLHFTHLNSLHFTHVTLIISLSYTRSFTAFTSLPFTLLHSSLLQFTSLTRFHDFCVCACLEGGRGER